MGEDKRDSLAAVIDLHARALAAGLSERTAQSMVNAQHAADNLRFNMVFTTGHADALPAEMGNRRWHVVVTEGAPLDVEHTRVWLAMDRIQRLRTSPENVRDVLDALERMRAAQPPV